MLERSHSCRIIIYFLFRFNFTDLKINSVHPGYVDTDMSSHNGPMTIDEGAVAPLYVALDAPDTLRGQLVWFNKDIVSWDGVKPDREF